MDILKQLTKEAKQHLESSEDTQQVIVAQTCDGKRYLAESKHILYGDHSEEEALLAELGKAQVSYLVCMWQEQFLDVPSQHLREGLMKANPGNGEAQVLLRGEKGLTPLALKELQ